MCVIICCDEKFPDKKTMSQAQKSNPDGAGISWVENNQVHWIKNISVKAIQKMITLSQVKTPAIIHFRIATSGGVTPELTHPFPLSDTVPLDLSGTSGEGVLFHNGIWSDDDDFFKLAMSDYVKKGVKIPFGKWSDSRVLAWCVNLYGLGFLPKYVDESNKVAILTPKGIIRFGEFCTVSKNLCSNDHFTNEFYTRFNYGNFDECPQYADSGIIDNDEILYQIDKKAQWLDNKEKENKSELSKNKKMFADFIIKHGARKKNQKKIKRLGKDDYITYCKIRAFCEQNSLVGNKITNEQLNDLSIMFTFTKKELVDKSAVKIALEMDKEVTKDNNFDYNGYQEEFNRFQIKDGKPVYVG